MKVEITYFNAFIPRGIFHDLMDANTPDEFVFDRIQGHTIQQVYNQLTDNTWTIQQFRDNWEDEYPSMDNEDLFIRYTIN